MEKGHIRLILKNKSKKIKLFIFLYIIILTISISINNAKTSPTQDFAAFYCAGRIIMDESTSIGEVYNLYSLKSLCSNKGLNVEPLDFLYSPVFAYGFSTFSFLPYELSKIVFNITNLLMYLISIILILRLCSIENRIFILILSLLWIPFYINQYWIQSNIMLLFLLVLGVQFATRNKVFISGLLFALTILIKLFPLAVVMVIGIKNWRILASCLITLTISFFLFDMTPWIEAVKKTQHPNYTPIYHLLNNMNSFYYLIYVAIIAGITAIIAYKIRKSDYITLASLSIPASLLVSPVVGGYYLVLLMVPIIYMFGISNKISRTEESLVLIIYLFSNIMLILFGLYSFISFLLWVYIIHLTLNRIQIKPHLIAKGNYLQTKY